jgi:hypothetical protein
MALTFKSIGKGLTKIAKVAAPVVGFANPLAGITLGAASGLGHGKKSLGKMAGGAALGAAGGVAGKLANVSKLGVLGGAKNLGSSALGGLGKLGKLGGKSLLNEQGGLDFSKLAGLGLGASAIKGSADKRKGADNFNAGNAALRQSLMDRLSQTPDYSALLGQITQRPNYKL